MKKIITQVLLLFLTYFYPSASALRANGVGSDQEFTVLAFVDSKKEDNSTEVIKVFSTFYSTPDKRSGWHSNNHSWHLVAVQDSFPSDSIIHAILMDMIPDPERAGLVVGLLESHFTGLSSHLLKSFLNPF